MTADIPGMHPESTVILTVKFFVEVQVTHLLVDTSQK